MPPLPKVDSALESRLSLDPHLISAYRICLKHEEELTSEDQVRRVRILGFLLLYTTKDDVRVYLTKSIFSCKDDSEMLVPLGLFIEQNVILPFRKYRGRTPATSTHPSRPSFEKHWQDMKAQITEAPKNHTDAKNLALIRDNWRCPITGYVDYNAPAEARPLVRDNSWVPGSHTECAHIIPEATFFNVKEKSKKFDYASCILTILRLFHYDISSFIGDKVHSLTNVMTMSKEVHECFDRLSLYFEAVPGKENYYQVKHFLPWTSFAEPLFVQFSTKDPQNLPVPSSELLALHATCCKVAHMSGAAEYIEKVYKDADAMGVLAFDGASSDILSFKLMSLASVDVQG